MPSKAENFTDLPLDALADVALSTASSAGASIAHFRVARHENRGVNVRDNAVENVASDQMTGLSVRVVVNGAWGFAGTTSLTTESVADAARRAVDLAIASSNIQSIPVELADEPGHGQQYWELPIMEDAMSKSDDEVIELLLGWTNRLSASQHVQHTEGHVSLGRDWTYFADLSGSRITQKRDRTSAQVTAINIGEHGFEDMRTCAPPAGRGWEYFTGTGWDWTTEIAELPDLLAQKVAAPSVEPGAWDVVIDPTNLWLTIHESIGHATELDRALGFEANYAGTSFATLDKLNNFTYGSPLMNVTGDRNAEHGLATVGFDDEGVAAQQWNLIKDGTLVGYQVDRATAGRVGLERSNGCAFADSPLHVPLQRMPNVSLQPDPNGGSTSDLISGVDRGIYIVGDKSWSIDMQRFNFQFTGQRFFEIRNGAIVGQLKDVAYQSRTPDFWGSMSAVGGPQTYLLGGALNCGKGQPGQTAPVSHGAPSARFDGVNILNTRAEAGQ